MRAAPPLIVLCGPTATGKTALGIALARWLRVPVLSADSRQVYREFDIGTAKPSPAERAAVEHRLIDIADPTETFNVARYKELATAEIERVHTEGKPALLVGGSGLYIRSVAGGLEPPAVPPNPALREQLASRPLPELVAELRRLDPVRAARLHPNDRIRIERALEVCLATGRPVAAQERRIQSYRVLTLGLTAADRKLLHERIARRTRAMVRAGWLEEVIDLRAQYGPGLPLLQTLGYAELGAHLEGRTDLETAIEQTITHTRQFAKRQLTWFRSESDIRWFDIALDTEQLCGQLQQEIEHFLET
jgi:tRNA dimethylallyltransferase